MNGYSLLTSGLSSLHIDYSEDMIEKLLCFSEFLLEKNKVMNLTAITSPEEVISRHFLDCAALVPFIKEEATVLDVGTGAGFPGIPLAILTKGEFTLLDAQRKRIDFLQEAIHLLGIKNCQAVHDRAEDFAKKHRASFDIAVSRAVASLNVLCEFSMPQIKPNGVFLAMKAANCEEEVREAMSAIKILGGLDAEMIPYEVPIDEVSRVLVNIKKSFDTPLQYPRRFKKIQANPL